MITKTNVKEELTMTTRPSEEFVRKKRARAAEPTVLDVLRCAREIWGRDTRKRAPTLTEDRKFREFFGCGPLVALSAWSLLVKTDYLPEKGTMEQFLWALMCLKIYGKEAVLCNLAGGVDPQTLRHWVWDEFIPALALLEPEVVSTQ